MCKTIFMLTLVSFVAQPLQGMSKSRTTSYHIPSQTQQPINQEKLILGGALAAGAALVYWLYRSSYKSSLKEAHASLEAAGKQYYELVNRYYDIGVNQFDAILCREGAAQLYREIEREKNNVNEILKETRKHKTAWDGYKDYQHAQADNLINNTEILKKSLAELTTHLDHRVALFVFSASSTEEIAQLAIQYQSDNARNKIDEITNLAQARAYQAELIRNTKKVSDYADDLTTYCSKYMTHPDSQIIRAQYLLEDARAIQKHMFAVQQCITQYIAQLEVNELYFSVDRAYRNEINLIWHQDLLETSIKGLHHKDQYPLLAYLTGVATARDNLRKQAKRIPDDFTESCHARALADELDLVIDAVVKMPAYDVQKENKQRADDLVAERQQKERLAREAQAAADRRAREEIEARERLAQKDRESQERIARQDREAKRQHDEEIAENQRRMARAKEQEAIAARKKAEAEQERVRIEAERLRLEMMRAARERLAGKPQGSNTQQDDHLL